jgi:hypothetical protein
VDLPEILIVERDAKVAHPSHARGGYVYLHPGATAYRNADFVAGDTGAMLAWCRGSACEVVSLESADPATRRFRIRFAEEATYVAFRSRFR